MRKKKTMRRLLAFVLTFMMMLAGPGMGSMTVQAKDEVDSGSDEGASGESTGYESLYICDGDYAFDGALRTGLYFVQPAYSESSLSSGVDSDGAGSSTGSGAVATGSEGASAGSTGTSAGSGVGATGSEGASAGSTGTSVGSEVISTGSEGASTDGTGTTSDGIASVYVTGYETNGSVTLGANTYKVVNLLTTMGTVNTGSARWMYILYYNEEDKSITHVTDKSMLKYDSDIEINNTDNYSIVDDSNNQAKNGLYLIKAVSGEGDKTIYPSGGNETQGVNIYINDTSIQESVKIKVDNEEIVFVKESLTYTYSGLVAIEADVDDSGSVNGFKKNTDGKVSMTGIVNVETGESKLYYIMYYKPELNYTQNKAVNATLEPVTVIGDSLYYNNGGNGFNLTNEGGIAGYAAKGLWKITGIEASSDCLLDKEYTYGISIIVGAGSTGGGDSQYGESTNIQILVKSYECGNTGKPNDNGEFDENTGVLIAEEYAETLDNDGSSIVIRIGEGGYVNGQQIVRVSNQGWKVTYYSKESVAAGGLDDPRKGSLDGNDVTSAVLDTYTWEGADADKSAHLYPFMKFTPNGDGYYVISSYDSSSSESSSDSDDKSGSSNVYDISSGQGESNIQSALIRVNVSANQEDVEGKQKAQQVIEAIKALPTSGSVTLSDEAVINAARKAFNDLGDAKQYVSNEQLARLVSAEEAIAALKAAEKAAEEEAAKQKAAEEEAAKQKAAEEEAAKQKAAEEEAAKQKAAEEEAAKQKAAEEEAAKQKAAEEAVKATTVAAGTETKDESGATYTVKAADAGDTSGTVEVEYTAADTTEKTVTIPSTVTVNGVEATVTTVAASAFEGNKTVTTVTIPSTVEEIGNNAFKGCANLTTVTIPASVEEIGDSAFRNCTKLKKVTIPKNVETVGKNAFAGCSSLTTVDIKSTTITKIDQGAFKNCKKLTKVTVTKNVTTIGKEAFSGDKKLKTITIKSTKLKSVGKNAFKGVPKSTTIKVPKKQKAAYTKLLKKAGFKGKVK